VASATTVAIYLQILVGATMRHTEAGLAIPDFPLVFGGLFPPDWTAAIAIHYAHRLGALMVAGAILATSGHVWFHHRSIGWLTRPALLAVVLVLIQIALGGLTVLTRRAVSVNTAHVVTGALLLATSLVITLRSWRVRFAFIGPRGAPPPRAAVANAPELASNDHPLPEGTVPTSVATSAGASRSCAAAGARA
jgi:cytochrome c oxidase assembly protein subunit 15